MKTVFEFKKECCGRTTYCPDVLMNFPQAYPEFWRKRACSKHVGVPIRLQYSALQYLYIDMSESAHGWAPESQQGSECTTGQNVFTYRATRFWHPSEPAKSCRLASREKNSHVLYQ